MTTEGLHLLSAPTRPAFGVDVGGTKILGCVIDLDAPQRPTVLRRVPTPQGAGALVDAIVELVGSLRAAGGVTPVAIGVGVAGLVDRAGVIRFSPNLATVVNLDLPAALREPGVAEVVVVNDATAALAAEHRLGAARGVDDAVLVTLGTGIGGGLVVGGSIRLGAAGFAGEPGHMVVDPNGPPCPCGRRGCWERFASGSALGARAAEAIAEGSAARVAALAAADADGVVHGEHVVAAATEGDAEAIALLADFAWWVGLGIANIVDLLDPARVVVGGGVVVAGDLLLDPVRAAFDSLVLGAQHRPPVGIVAAELGPEAGAVGAALLAGDLAPS